MTDDERDRITRLEERLMGVEKAMNEVSRLLQEFTKEAREQFVLRSECTMREGRTDDRVMRLEARVRDCETEQRALRDQLSTLAAKPAPPPAEPGWTKILIALVSILGGALITLIVTLSQ